MEVRIGVKGIRGRRRKELLGDLKEKRGYCKLKRKHYIAPCGELALEEIVDLS